MEIAARIAWMALVAGCGRIGFANLSDGGGTGDDSSDAFAAITTVPISTTGSCPSAAWSGGRIGVVWREGTNFGAASVMFAAYDLNGTLLQGPLAIGTNLTYVECPAIAWTGAQFLLAISSGLINKRDIDTAIVTASGASALTNVVNDSGDSTAPHLASLANHALLVWLDQTGTNYRAMSMALSDVGASLQAEATLGNESDDGAPRVTATAMGFAAMWTGGGASRVRALDLAGAPTTSETAIAGIDLGGDLAWTGSDLFGAWTAGGVTSDVTTARFDLAGTVTAGPFTFNGMRPGLPSLVWTGTEAAVVYDENYGLVQYWLAVVGANGMLSTQGAIVSSGVDSFSSIALAGSNVVAGLASNNGAVVKIVPL